MPILTSACATRPWWVNEWLVIDVGEIFSFLLINNKLGVPGVASYRGQPCVHKSIQPTNQVFWASAPTALTYFPPGLYYTRWCNINCHGICMQSDDWMQYKCGARPSACRVMTKCASLINTTFYSAPCLLMAYVSATISAETVLTKCANIIQMRYICELGYVWNRLTRL